MGKAIVHFEVEIGEDNEIIVSAQGPSWAVLAIEDALKHAQKREHIVVPDYPDFTE